MKLTIKDMAIIGMLSTLLLGVKHALVFLPNVSPVTLFLIIYTLYLKRKAIYIICIFVIIEGLLYGFGLWWFCYLYIWFIPYFIARCFPGNNSPGFWAIVSGIYGLAFGALSSLVTFAIGFVTGGLHTGISSAFAYFISGIPFDITHGISNFVFALFLFKPLNYIFTKLFKESNNHEEST